MIHYTQPRFTKDLDVWIEPSPLNAKHSAAAMREFGIPLIEITETDLATPGTQFMVGRSPVQIDFLTSVPPLEFASSWKRRKSSRHEDFRIHYLGLDDLRIAKAHAARQVDLADLEEIERIVVPGRTRRPDAS